MASSRRRPSVKRTDAPASKRFASSCPNADHEAENLVMERGEIEDLEGVVPLPGAIELLTSLPPHRWTIVTSCTRAVGRSPHSCRRIAGSADDCHLQRYHQREASPRALPQRAQAYWASRLPTALCSRMCLQAFVPARRRALALSLCVPPRPTPTWLRPAPIGWLIIVAQSPHRGCCALAVLRSSISLDAPTSLSRPRRSASLDSSFRRRGQAMFRHR